MIPLGLTWIRLNTLGLTWSRLGLTWTQLDSLALTWNHLTSLELTWLHLDSIEGQREKLPRPKGKGNRHTLGRQSRPKRRMAGRRQSDGEHDRRTIICIFTSPRDEQSETISQLDSPPNLRCNRQTHLGGCARGIKVVVVGVGI